MDEVMNRQCIDPMDRRSPDDVFVKEMSEVWDLFMDRKFVNHD
jgi:hypothetical protein